MHSYSAGLHGPPSARSAWSVRSPRSPPYDPRQQASYKVGDDNEVRISEEEVAYNVGETVSEDPEEETETDTEGQSKEAPCPRASSSPFGPEADSYIATEPMSSQSDCRESDSERSHSFGQRLKPKGRKTVEQSSTGSPAFHRGGAQFKQQDRKYRRQSDSNHRYGPRAQSAFSHTRNLDPESQGQTAQMQMRNRNASLTVQSPPSAVVSPVGSPLSFEKARIGSGALEMSPVAMPPPRLALSPTSALESRIGNIERERERLSNERHLSPTAQSPRGVERLVGTARSRLSPPPMYPSIQPRLSQSTSASASAALRDMLYNTSSRNDSGQDRARQPIVRSASSLGHSHPSPPEFAVKAIHPYIVNSMGGTNPISLSSPTSPSSEFSTRPGLHVRTFSHSKKIVPNLHIDTGSVPSPISVSDEPLVKSLALDIPTSPLSPRSPIHIEPIAFEAFRRLQEAEERRELASQKQVFQVDANQAVQQNILASLPAPHLPYDKENHSLLLPPTHYKPKYSHGRSATLARTDVGVSASATTSVTSRSHSSSLPNSAKLTRSMSPPTGGTVVAVRRPHVRSTSAMTTLQSRVGFARIPTHTVEPKDLRSGSMISSCASESSDGEDDTKIILGTGTNTTTMTVVGTPGSINGSQKGSIKSHPMNRHSGESISSGDKQVMEKLLLDQLEKVQIQHHVVQQQVIENPAFAREVSLVRSDSNRSSRTDGLSDDDGSRAAAERRHGVLLQQQRSQLQQLQQQELQLRLKLYHLTGDSAGSNVSRYSYGSASNGRHSMSSTGTNGHTRRPGSRQSAGAHASKSPQLHGTLTVAPGGPGMSGVVLPSSVSPIVESPQSSTEPQEQTVTPVPVRPVLHIHTVSPPPSLQKIPAVQSLNCVPSLSQAVKASEVASQSLTNGPVGSSDVVSPLPSDHLQPSQFQFPKLERQSSKPNQPALRIRTSISAESHKVTNSIMSLYEGLKLKTKRSHDSQLSEKKTQQDCARENGADPAAGSVHSASGSTGKPLQKHLDSHDGAVQPPSRSWSHGLFTWGCPGSSFVDDEDPDTTDVMALGANGDVVTDDLATCFTGLVFPCVIHMRTKRRFQIRDIQQTQLRASNAHPDQQPKPDASVSSDPAVAPSRLSKLASRLSFGPFETRARARREYNLSGSGATDFAAVALCPLCAVIQTEREVRDQEARVRRARIQERGPTRVSVPASVLRLKTDRRSGENNQDPVSGAATPSIAVQPASSDGVPGEVASAPTPEPVARPTVTIENPAPATETQTVILSATSNPTSGLLSPIPMIGFNPTLSPIPVPMSAFFGSPVMSGGANGGVSNPNQIILANPQRV